MRCLFCAVRGLPRHDHNKFLFKYRYLNKISYFCALNLKIMNIRGYFILNIIIWVLFMGCKSDIKDSADLDSLLGGSAQSNPNDSKALKGTGAEDISDTYVLDSTQIVQEGNVGFNFKSGTSMRIYLDMPGDKNINFDTDEVFAIISEKTVKQTSFKVESIDLNSERPTIKIVTKVSKNTVPEYRPSFVLSVPKNKISTYPLIQLDGLEIPIFTLN